MPDTAASDPVRIVSFSPALTQMVIDLGARDRIVGVGRFDPLAGTGPAIVGDLNQYDYEKLLSLDPTVILLQPPASGVPTKMQTLAREYGWRLHAYGIDTVADAKRALYDTTGVGVGAAIGRAEQARALRERIEWQLANLGVATIEQPVADVLLVVGVGAKVTAAGPDTFLDELLSFAGGVNVLPGGINDYPQLDREKIVSLNPRVIIIAHTASSDPPQEIPSILADLDVAAVRAGRVHWLVDEQALLPSTTMPRIAGKLARLLHPDLAADIQAILSDPDTSQDASPITR